MRYLPYHGYHGKREQAAPKAPQSLWIRIVKQVYPYVILVLVLFVLLQFTIMLNYVPTGSMLPTIPEGSLLVSTRYDVGDIKRYDIVIFWSPVEEDTVLIKRVIGLPGETITIFDGNVYADGVKLDDSFLAEPMDDSGEGVYEVPEDSCFVLGDNRNDSWDSRFIGCIPAENMVAKAKFILYPFSRAGFLCAFAVGRAGNSQSIF